MSASRAANRPFFRRAFPIAAAFAVALSGCDAADPHVPAVVRAPASAVPSPSLSSTQAAASPSGLAPPVMHRVD